MTGLLKTFLQLSPNPIVITDDAGTIVDANNNFASSCGYSEDELIGQNIAILNSPQNPPELHQQLWQTIQNGRTWQGTFINRRKNGALYRVRAAIAPLPHNDGHPKQCFMGIYEDISEQEKIKHVLSIQANLLRELSQRIPGLIFQLQRFPDGRYCMPYASAPLVRFFGCKPEDVVDSIEPLLNLLHPEDAPFFRSSLQISAADLSEWEQDFRVSLPGSRQRWYSGRASPELLEDQSILWHGYISDITRLKQTESELENKAELLRNQNYVLQRAQFEAGQANRIKSQFLANISHEIRTPMNGIVGATSLLSETSLSSDQEEYVNILQASSESMMQVINSILDFSKLESKNVAAEESVFDVADLFEEVASRLRSSAEAKGLTFEITVPPEARLEVRSDPHHIRQILLNLGQNAIKFTASGSIRLSMEVQASRNGRRCVRFSISDTGIGIPPQKQKEIFEPFAQVDDSNTRAYGGTGLGLAICRMLTESLHGQLSVQSRPGEGSTFCLELPLKILPKRKTEPADSPPTPHKTHAPNPHILLVEDDAGNRAVIQRILDRMPCRITAAINGLDALEKVKEGSFDLILMDCQMPIMDGFQTTRRIRNGDSGKCPADIPILALTALALDGDQERCLEAGMDAYIAKPVQRKQLQQTIQQFLA